MTAAIVGWAHTPFGKHSEESVESLIVTVARDAIADAGFEPGDIDEIVLGHFNAGFSAQDFTASLVLQADPALRFKRATRVENAWCNWFGRGPSGGAGDQFPRGARGARRRRRADDHDTWPGDR